MTEGMRPEDAAMPIRGEDSSLGRLLNGLCDGMLSQAEEEHLASILERDAVARRRYREWLELHAALNWDYALAATHRDDPPAMPDAAADGSRESGWRATVAMWKPAATALAAIALLALLTLGVYARGVRNQVVEVMALDGAASWSRAGRVVTNLAVGGRLSDGTVCLEGESSFVRLKFEDGSEAALSGPSMLEFADQGQKRLVLRHGSLFVNARPQPRGRPMKVLTPTAEVEVVGTVFSVSADSGETRLGVEAGKVRLRRLADGRLVDVPQHHVATASLESSRPIDVRKPGAIPDDWEARFEVRPDRQCQGEWIEPEPHGEFDAPVPGRLRAVPRVAGHRPDGAPIVHYGVAMQRPESGFVMFHADSVVALRFRMEVPRVFRVMLNLRRLGGGFAGNCQVVLPVDAGAERIGPGGWREIEIPAPGFRPITDFDPLTGEPCCIALLLVDAFDRDANLEVSDLSVRRRSP
jgi:hypothetical protein